MTKLTRLVDLQISVPERALRGEELHRANHVLFTVYEPLRLWLRERQLHAPFRELAISLQNEDTSRATHGRVVNANSVCVVDFLAPLSILKHIHRDRPWAFAAMIEALGWVRKRLNWKSDELEARINEVSEAGLPFTHDFVRLTKTDRSTQTMCIPWMRFTESLIQIGVRFSSPDKVDREKIVFARPPPLFMEESFPIHRSMLRGRSFILLDRAGNQLAHVPCRVD